MLLLVPAVSNMRQQGHLHEPCTHTNLTTLSLLLPDQLKMLCAAEEPLLAFGLCDLKCAAVLAAPARRILATALQHTMCTHT